MHTNFDPFRMVKISEQIDMIAPFAGNSTNVNMIKGEIVQVNGRLEEMISQNTNYMVELNDTKDLVFSRTSMNDIDTSSISWDVKDYFVEQQVALDNQAVGIKDIPEQFNLSRGTQKANLVLIRVGDMLANSSVKDTKVSEISTPKLVIGPKQVVLENDELVDDDDMYDDLSTLFDDSEEEKITASTDVGFSTYDSDIFETVIPFETTPMFTDRTDDSLETETLTVEDSLSTEELEEIGNKKDTNLELYYSSGVEDEMPEAFWVTQEDDNVEGYNDFELSFDDQVNALLGVDDHSKIIPFESKKNDVKTRKLEFGNDITRKVA